MPLKEAAKIGDVFVTTTGDKNVIGRDHFLRMKDGAVVANSGHFNVEIDIPTLEKMSQKKRKIRDFVEEFSLKNGKKIYLLAEGRLINLSAAEGHPATVMDMSFANQALCVLYLNREGKSLKKEVYAVPEKIDKEIARLKLKALGVKIDKLTPEQKKYLAGWQEGT
jgi:adenosylhomocysteinase